MKQRRFGNRIRNMSPARFILLGFALVILTGSLLLMLPVSSADGTFTPYIDALFTSTTSVCVTGLVTVSTAFHWSPFGQFVIFLLMQFGGMGVVAVMVMIMLMLHRRIGMKNRILIKQSYGLDSIKGVVRFLRRIIRGMILVEFLGFLCYLPVFCPRYGSSGVWKSLFLSVSAFCNAGMDLLGDNSLVPFAGNFWVNIVTMVLIVLGGLGFIVWWELIDDFMDCIRGRKPFDRVFKNLSLHAKVVLSTTLFLLLAGMLVVLFCEYDNPETLGQMSFPGKCMAALFQSVTTRTAGFFTIPQERMTDAASMICMVLMFIGGSPAGTAGGVKTVTIAILGAAIFSEIYGRDKVVAFRRTIASDFVRKALTILGFSFLLWMAGTAALCLLENVDFMRICYETVSAIGTVGLSKAVTGGLHTGGKLVIICLMYAGRIGPATLATAFLTKENTDTMIQYADETILLG